MAGKMLIVDEKSGAAIRELVNCALVLNQRYNECDKNGHRKIDEASSMCNYCYRHLSYETPETDRIYKERKKHPEYQPCDAPLLVEREMSEIEIQKSFDWSSGIRKLMEEPETGYNV